MENRCVDAKLEPDPALSDIYVLASPTHWLLVANRPMQNVDGVHRQSLPGGYGNPLVNGVRAYLRPPDGQQGGLDGRSIATDCCSASPATCRCWPSPRPIFDATNGRGRNQQTSLLFLDKRTGRVVYEGSLPNAIPTIDLVGEPERNHVQLKTPGIAVKLTFTGEPVPEAPADKDKVGDNKPGDGKAGDGKPATASRPAAGRPTTSGSAARAVMRGLRRLTGLNGSST